MSPLGPVHILVVEDNVPDVMLIGECFRDQGIEFEMTHFRDGEEALRNLANVHSGASVFDLVVLDLNMPRVGGLEVLAKLRSFEPFKDVPVLVLTSSLAPDEQRDARLLGADRYLKKPADLYQFLGEVGNAVKQMLATGKRRREVHTAETSD